MVGSSASSPKLLPESTESSWAMECRWFAIATHQVADQRCGQVTLPTHRVHLPGAPCQRIEPGDGWAPTLSLFLFGVGHNGFLFGGFSHVLFSIPEWLSMIVGWFSHRSRVVKPSAKCFLSFNNRRIFLCRVIVKLWKGAFSMCVIYGSSLGHVWCHWMWRQRWCGNCWIHRSHFLRNCMNLSTRSTATVNGIGVGDLSAI